MKAMLALCGLLAALSGCASCEPLLDVRNCLDSQCEPSDDAVELDWNAGLAAEWPQITAAMDRSELGEHDHIAWSDALEQELWDAFGVSGDKPELIIHHEDERYRVRVLSCQ